MMYKPLGVVAFYTSRLAALMALAKDRSLVLYSTLKQSFLKDKTDIFPEVERANKLLEGATFKTFETDDICAVQLDLNKESFQSIVKSVVSSYGLEDRHELLINNLSLGNDNAMQIRNICVTVRDGSVVYGKFAVVKKNKLIDLAYAVYTATYEFNPTCRYPRELNDVSWDYTYTTNYPRVPATDINVLSSFFEYKAIEALVLKC